MRVKTRFCVKFVTESNDIFIHVSEALLQKLKLFVMVLFKLQNKSYIA